MAARELGPSEVTVAVAVRAAAPLRPRVRPAGVSIPRANGRQAAAAETWDSALFGISRPPSVLVALLRRRLSRTALCVAGPPGF